MGAFPAAHIGSTTAHGGTVTVGMPTVIIGGTPASRIGDMHVCPMQTPAVVPIPHVGGPFVLGAFNVLVGGVPLSRVNDMLICVGPPDTCLVGVPTVMVGMQGAMGLLGLILGGLLAGVANFAGGYPKAELQPDGTTVTKYSPQITIKGSPEYQAAVIADLNKFLATPTGQRWNAAYAATGHNITIQPLAANQQQNNAFTQPMGPGARPNADGTPGAGADSTITYNPSLTSQYTAADGSTQDMPPDQTLGHEMIHGLHNGQGNDLQGNRQPPPYDNEEESQTIGVNGHENDPITEKTMADDNGQSNRPDHDSITRDVYQDSSGQWHDTTTNNSTGRSTDTLIPPPANARPNH